MARITPLKAIASILSLFAFALCIPDGRADERVRPERPEELLDGTQPEDFVRLSKARVGYMNLRALRRDFPQLAGLNEEAIRTWILDNFAYISPEQLRLEGIRNSRIPVDRSLKKRFFRPDFWNRAAVTTAELQGQKLRGLVDLKSNGLRPEWKGPWQIEQFAKARATQDPVERKKILDQLRGLGHSNGIGTFDEAAAEALRSEAVQRLFEIYNKAHGTDYQANEVYFIIDPGFDVLQPGRKSSSAGIVARQAQWGRGIDLEVPESIYRDDLGNRQRSSFDVAIDYGDVAVMDPKLQKFFSLLPGTKLTEDRRYDFEFTPAMENIRAAIKDFRSGRNPHALDQAFEAMLKPISQSWEEARQDKHPLPERVAQQKRLLDLLASSEPEKRLEDIRSALKPLLSGTDDPADKNFLSNPRRFFLTVAFNRMSAPLLRALMNDLSPKEKFAAFMALGYAYRTPPKYRYDGEQFEMAYRLLSHQHEPLLLELAVELGSRPEITNEWYPDHPTGISARWNHGNLYAETFEKTLRLIPPSSEQQLDLILRVASDKSAHKTVRMRIIDSLAANRGTDPRVIAATVRILQDPTENVGVRGAVVHALSAAAKLPESEKIRLSRILLEVGKTNPEYLLVESLGVVDMLTPNLAEYHALAASVLEKEFGTMPAMNFPNYLLDTRSQVPTDNPRLLEILLKDARDRHPANLTEALIRMAGNAPEKITPEVKQALLGLIRDSRAPVYLAKVGRVFPNDPEVLAAARTWMESGRMLPVHADELRLALEGKPAPDRRKLPSDEEKAQIETTALCTLRALLERTTALSSH